MNVCERLTESGFDFDFDFDFDLCFGSGVRRGHDFEPKKGQR